MKDITLGIVTHYYNKIGVAVVKVKGSLKVGDQVKVSGHDQEFIQQISSMQVEHEMIEKAKKGDEVGLKVDQPVKEGDMLYKVE